MTELIVWGQRKYSKQIINLKHNIPNKNHLYRLYIIESWQRIFPSDF